MFCQLFSCYSGVSGFLYPCIEKYYMCNSPKMFYGKAIFSEFDSDSDRDVPKYCWLSRLVSGMAPNKGPSVFPIWVRNRAGENRPGDIRPNHFVYTCVGTHVSTHVSIRVEAFVWDYNTEKANFLWALSCKGCVAPVAATVPKAPEN